MEFFSEAFSSNTKSSKSKHKKSNQIKSLPSTFFEDVLDLEFSLRRSFRFEILKEIIYMYSVRLLLLLQLAIEHYESVEDRRHKDYQNRLNHLLSQPEILKKMNQANNPNYRKSLLLLR